MSYDSYHGPLVSFTNRVASSILAFCLFLRPTAPTTHHAIISRSHFFSAKVMSAIWMGGPWTSFSKKGFNFEMEPHLGGWLAGSWRSQRSSHLHARAKSEWRERNRLRFVPLSPLFAVRRSRGAPRAGEREGERGHAIPKKYAARGRRSPHCPRSPSRWPLLFASSQDFRMQTAHQRMRASASVLPSARVLMYHILAHISRLTLEPPQPPPPTIDAVCDVGIRTAFPRFNRSRFPCNCVRRSFSSFSLLHNQCVRVVFANCRLLLRSPFLPSFPLDTDRDRRPPTRRCVRGCALSRPRPSSCSLSLPALL